MGIFKMKKSGILLFCGSQEEIVCRKVIISSERLIKVEKRLIVCPFGLINSIKRLKKPQIS
jgi:hypothetical protein